MVTKVGACVISLVWVSPLIGQSSRLPDPAPGRSAGEGSHLSSYTALLSFSSSLALQRPEDHCPYFTVTGLRLREVRSLVQSYAELGFQPYIPGLRSVCPTPPSFGALLLDFISYRARMVQFSQPKRRPGAWSLKRQLPRGPGKGRKPRLLLLLLRMVCPRPYLHHWPERQRSPRAQEGLACPPRPCHPMGPVRR